LLFTVALEVETKTNPKLYRFQNPNLACSNKDDFTSKYQQIMECCKDTKTLAASLRKCVKEMSSMIKVPFSELHELL
jgi:hypothetical protein